MSTDTDWTVEGALAELNADGHAPHPARPADGWAAWSAWGTRVEKRLKTQASNTANLAAALKQQLARERAERIKLEREVTVLKAELSTTRKFDEIMSRLDKIESSSPSRGASLRAVVT